MARKLNKAKKAEGSLVSRQREKLEAQRAEKRTQQSDAESARKAANAAQYEKEKAARQAKGGKGYGGGYSQHLMGGNVRSSSYDRHSGRIVHEQILSYLLGEGFASDEKSASAIASAMSEEWRESIVEELLNERLTGRRVKRAITKFQDQNERPDQYRKPSEDRNPKPNYTLGAVARHKEGSPNPHNSATPEDYRDSGNRPTRRGGRGGRGEPKTGYYGTDRRDSDRGSGNAAKRRMGDS